MKEWFKKLMSGLDNETPDMGRWSWLTSTAAVIVAAGWNATHGAITDLMQLAQALSAVAIAHGGALWAKAKTEPEAK